MSEIVRPGVVSAVAVLRKQFLKGRGQVHLSHTGIGLRFDDVQATPRQVHVAPAKLHRLADSQARERKGRQERVATAAVTLPPFGVEEGCGAEKCGTCSGCR